MARWRLDALLLIALALAACLAALEGQRRVPASLSLHREGYDIWFEGDSPRAYAVASTRWPDPKYHKYHTRRHPLFILMTLPLVQACRVAFGLSPLQAVQILMGLVAALWVGALFTLLRLWGCRRPDAVLFSLLAASSAAAVFWFSVPETWGLGSLSLLAPLLLVAWTRVRPIPLWGYVAASAISLSITVTNWMAGIVAAFVQLPWRRAIQVTVSALCLVTLLWGVQQLLLPNRIQFFLKTGNDTRYMLQRESGGPLQITKAFVFHAMLMPAITDVLQGNRPGLTRMSAQRSVPGSATPWGRAGVWAWGLLIGLGLAGMPAAIRRHRSLALTVLLTLLGQYLFHLVYGGEETFLYALHWLPLLVLLAACSTLTRARPFALALAAGLLVCAVVNNIRQFSMATTHAARYMNIVEGSS